MREHWRGVLGLEAGDGRIESFGDRADEAAAIGREASKTPLSELAVVEISGADADSFLHAQLCADLRRLDPGASVLSAWCSPQGRVLYLLRALRTPGGFMLLVPLDQIESLLKRLRMFVLRAAVEITDHSASHVVLRCDHWHGTAPATAALVARELTQTWLLATADHAAATWAAINARAVGEAAASIEDIRRGVPRLAAALSDVFLPQELNLDASAGLSFEKGCYPGQEIIARVKFRGSVKRRLARLAAVGASPSAPGTRLVDDHNKAVGTVLNAETAGADGVEILAVVNRDAETLALAEHAGQLLQRLELPYKIDD